MSHSDWDGQQRTNLFIAVFMQLLHPSSGFTLNFALNRGFGWVFLTITHRYLKLSTVNFNYRLNGNSMWRHVSGLCVYVSCLKKKQRRGSAKRWHRILAFDLWCCWRIERSIRDSRLNIIGKEREHISVAFTSLFWWVCANRQKGVCLMHWRS